MTDVQRSRIAEMNATDSIVVAREDLDPIIHELELNSHVLMTWDYERSRPALVKLYEKAKTSQWNGTTDLPWDTDVDVERLGPELSAATERFRILGDDMSDSPVAHW